MQTETTRPQLTHRVAQTGNSNHRLVVVESAPHKFTVEPRYTRSAPIGSRPVTHRIASVEAYPRGGYVTGAELQTAVLLILALYASLALLNFRNEFSNLVQHWQSFIEFLSQALC